MDGYTWQKTGSKQTAYSSVMTEGSFIKWIFAEAEAELRETNKQKQEAITSLRTVVSKQRNCVTKSGDMNPKNTLAESGIKQPTRGTLARRELGK